ncbi:MAG: SDR family NAD(P)-dependent oxidoreductase [Ilumatobacteraceae bacterium]
MTADSGLSGRRVLITGGGSGVGADLARGFSEAGAHVVITGRRHQPLEAVADSLANVEFLVGDVTDEATVVGWFEGGGPVDVVIANAGAADSAPIHRTTLALWNEMLAVNLTGVFLTLRQGARQMRGREWGRLVTIASTAGLTGYPYVSAYSAAKHGAVGLTSSIAKELSATGITANALCPGYVDTEMTERTIANIVDKTGQDRDTARSALTSTNPQGRLIQPAEVTAAALWLCAEGSESITGQAIAIAGGEL